MQRFSGCFFLVLLSVLSCLFFCLSHFLTFKLHNLAFGPTCMREFVQAAVPIQFRPLRSKCCSENIIYFLSIWSCRILILKSPECIQGSKSSCDSTAPATSNISANDVGTYLRSLYQDWMSFWKSPPPMLCSQPTTSRRTKVRSQCFRSISSLQVSSHLFHSRSDVSSSTQDHHLSY
jgi:hypothetical protein